MTTWKRVHCTGTEAIVNQHSDSWRTQLNLKEPDRNPMTIAGYLAPTADLAKEIADKELVKYGHLCTEACKNWVQVI